MNLEDLKAEPRSQVGERAALLLKELDRLEKLYAWISVDTLPWEEGQYLVELEDGTVRERTYAHALTSTFRLGITRWCRMPPRPCHDWSPDTMPPGAKVTYYRDVVGTLSCTILGWSDVGDTVAFKIVGTGCLVKYSVGSVALGDRVVRSITPPETVNTHVLVDLIKETIKTLEGHDYRHTEAKLRKAVADYEGTDA